MRNDGSSALIVIDNIICSVSAKLSFIRYRHLSKHLSNSGETVTYWKKQVWQIDKLSKLNLDISGILI